MGKLCVEHGILKMKKQKKEKIENKVEDKGRKYKNRNESFRYYKVKNEKLV